MRLSTLCNREQTNWNWLEYRTFPYREQSKLITFSLKSLPAFQSLWSSTAFNPPRLNIIFVEEYPHKIEKAMSSILPLDYGSVRYPVLPEYGRSFFPNFKDQCRPDRLRTDCHVVYPGFPSFKQQSSPSQGRSLLPCSKYSPYYSLFGAMLDKQPSAFRAHTPTGKPARAHDEPGTSDQSAARHYYNDRRVCTCMCTLTSSRVPSMQEYYSWTYPTDRPYFDVDLPIGLRLSTLTTRPYPTMLSRRLDDDKRPAPKRFQCPHCEKSFGKSSHLRDHIRTHTGDRPYKCEYCDKAFTQYSNLRTHTRIHTGERPYRCSHCTKSFTQAVTLRSHTRTHLGEKAYHCKQCTKSFTCFSGLQNHIVQVHETSQATLDSQESLQGTKLAPSIKQEIMDDSAD